MDYACIQDRFLTDNFTVGHKRGCVRVQVCHQLFGATCQNGGECRDPRGFCCKADLCNKVTSMQRANPNINVQQGNHLIRRTNNNNVCHDVDPNACKMIKNSRPHACNTSCFQQACPRACGVCVECSSCNKIDLPEHCNTTSVCDLGEKCYTLKTRSTEGIIKYKLGCLHQKGCDALRESVSDVFGRSDNIDFTLQGHCCSGNLCNVVKPSIPVSSPIILINSGCSARSFTWKDCLPSTTAHPYITFTSMSVTPSPVVLPGCFSVGVQGAIHHNFGRDVKMVAHMDKQLLGVWTKVPCFNDFGTCNYDNPCELLSAFETSGTCPTFLEQNGFPCTCPFNPTNINLPPTWFQVKHLSSAWQWLATGRFRLQVELIHGHEIVGCVHAEIDIKTHGGGILG